MKVYVVAEANNVSGDVYVSDGFRTKKEAQKHMRENYNKVLSNVYAVEKSISRNSYSVYDGSDLFYGEIKTIEVPV